MRVDLAILEYLTSISYVDISRHRREVELATRWRIDFQNLQHVIGEIAQRMRHAGRNVYDLVGPYRMRFVACREDTFAAPDDVDIVRLRVTVDPAALPTRDQAIEVHVDFFSPDAGVDHPDRFAAPILHGLRRGLVEIEYPQHVVLARWVVTRDGKSRVSGHAHDETIASYALRYVLPQIKWRIRRVGKGAHAVDVKQTRSSKCAPCPRVPSSAFVDAWARRRDRPIVYSTIVPGAFAHPTTLRHRRPYRHPRSIGPREDRACSGTSRQHLGGAFFAGHADGGGERIGGRGTRADHGRVGERVGAHSGSRVENMMEAAALIEGRAVAAGNRERHVFEFDGLGNAVLCQCVADAEPPGAALRVAADGAEFAEIDHRGFKAFVTQQVGDRVGDETLRHAVEGDPHMGARE